jgi:putative NIF3 family GTP cyclohydrolase 1 type 2
MVVTARFWGWRRVTNVAEREVDSGMKIKEILEHFLSRAEWIDPDKSVDRVIVGDPEKHVSRAMVTWMPSFSAIRTAVERGVELLICHEPTFWEHRDDVPAERAAAVEKKRFVEEHDLAILRNHCCWDRWPEIGIPWAWAAFLGLEGKPSVIGNHGYQHRYDIPPIPFGQFAENVAARTAIIGEPMVEVAGDLEKHVSRIGIGTGAACSVFAYAEMGCDCCIVCDDGASYWRQVQYAEDVGTPVICVNHGTSEEPGMVTLTKYINEHFEGVFAEHLPQGCRYQLVGH